MKRNTKTICLLLFAFTSIATFSGCHEKGCTDKNAINYNSVADVDDGSCITCQSTTEILGTNSTDLFDNNFSSPHYNQQVATFYVTQLKDKYTYTECGTNNCYFQVRIESLVSEQMSFTFNLQANGNIFFNYSGNAVVPGSQTVSIDNVPQNIISNPCGFFASTSLFVSTNGTIHYN